jgi:hypothetical protein
LTGRAALGVAIAALLAANPASAAAPASKAPPVVYALKVGDTLYDLAGHYFRNQDDYVLVQRLNHIRAPRRLPVGYQLKVPRGLLRSETIEARVVDVAGEATVLVQGRETPIRRGTSVGEGAQIATGANAFVRFELPDGSFVTLPSQSRFDVQTLRRTPLTETINRAFVLRSGRSEAVVTPMKRPGDSFIIRTPLSTAAVRGTVFRVNFDPRTGLATTEVVEGIVGLSSTLDGSTAVVNQAFGDHVTRDGVGAPHALLSAPQLESPARVQDGPSISLRIIPLVGAVRYRAQLASDAGALDAVAETEADTPALAFDKVPNGAWFVRLTALDSDGFEGLPSVYGFERYLHTLDLGSPSPIVRDAKAGWLFRWVSNGDGEHRYRFQLGAGEDTTTTPLLDETDLTQPRVIVTALPDGVYWWRVRSTLLIGDKRLEKWSPAQPFRIGR